MTLETTTPGRELQLCALVSKANGEEPIGSAAHFEICLVMELTLPWPKDAWQAAHLPAGLLDLFKRVEAQGVKLRPQAVIPDPDYSKPGYTRLICYRRPAARFSRYQKQEYLVPDGQVTALAEALLEQPSALSRFEPYRQETDHIREILVCTHGSRDTCCGSFGFRIYEPLRRDYATSETLRVWRTSHTGGHRFAPTLIDFPEGRYWGRVEADILDNLLHRRGSVVDLAESYRGWSALTTLEQVAERDIWLQEGWIGSITRSPAGL
jgi:hypothetical protein